MARAWLIGAISPKRDRQSAHPDPPEPASSGGYFIFWSANFIIRPAQAGTGDPDPGARARMRAPEARGLPEGTRRKPDTDGRANQGSLWRRAVESAATKFFCNLVCRIVRPTNAGGEDLGYFAPPSGEKSAFNRSYRGIRPAGGCDAGCGEAISRTCVSIVVIPISPVPQRAFRSPRRSNAPRHGGGEDVCYFGESAGRHCGRRSRGSKPAGSNAVAQSCS